MSGKPGRPPEDRLKRQHEIFLAVAPLIERHGAKRLTMRQAAWAAHLSLGGLYHYFPTKRDLVLHALKPEAVARVCADFHGRHADLERTDPGRYVQADVDYMARQCFFIRPPSTPRWNWTPRWPGTTSRPVSKAAWSHAPDRWPTRCPSAPPRRSAALAAACGAPSSPPSSTAP
jgi:AcrR family transcriptional regulator